jgi:UDP-N-acetyl-D-mannosaminuronic acid dehydrogenase
VVEELATVHRVIGGVDQASTEHSLAFYRGVLPGALTGTDAQTAEMTKLAENAARDVGIAFANELSLLCDEVGVDAWQVIDLANRHPRVNILRPGPGVGGHCVAVDPWFLINGTMGPTPLLRAARAVNQGKERWVIERVMQRASRLKTPVVACLGLTYKADVRDLRESPALAIARGLTAALEGEVLSVDPHVQGVEGVSVVPLELALERADLVVVLVAHEAFVRIPRGILVEKVVLDFCGALR